jgi:hypothetical protein
LRLVWSSSIYTARIQAHCSTINFEIFKHLKSTHMTEYKRAMSKVSIHRCILHVVLYLSGQFPGR